MYKSNHRYGGYEIPVEELSNFINPINMTLEVNKNSLDSVFNNYMEVRDYINTFYKEIIDAYIPSMDEDKSRRFIRYNTTISYTPHTSGYDFRFNPVDFINELFKFMNLDYQIPYINLDNQNGLNYLKDYVRAYIKDFKRDEELKKLSSYDAKLAIIEDLNKNLDEIVKIYYRSLDNTVNNYVIPKDMLLYLALKSLDLFEESNRKEEKYLVLPFEYYRYVSHMRNNPYPHKIYFNNYRRWFDDFRAEYTSMCDPLYRVDDIPYIIHDNEILLAWDILKPGMLERQIRDTHQFVRSVPNVDYDKYLELFEQKMNYYMKSGYKNYIQGKYGLNGYIGFAYKNEYLLFDKFHNSETIDPSRKTILTHGEAVFALPSDRFDIVKGDKQKVLDARKYDSRIKKVNHTPTFTNRLDDIIHGPNVSYASFDKIIEQEKKKILIKK